MDLAGIFNPIYDRKLVLSDNDPIPEALSKARLRFYHAARIVFKRALTLMGMSSPEFMERREKEPSAADPTAAPQPIADSATPADDLAILPDEE